ncbi:MAG: hypothetical protein ACXACK_02695 [Candidatus Hodarchaeales archaeon]
MNPVGFTHTIPAKLRNLSVWRKSGMFSSSGVGRVSSTTTFIINFHLSLDHYTTGIMG